MIIKGGPRAKGQDLASHLLRTDTNEQVRVLDMAGVLSATVPGAMAEMEAVAAGSRASKPLYHVSISPEANEVLTPEQWRIAADRLGAALGLQDHQRVIVFHRKEGREHCHVVWNRIDADTLLAAHHSHNYRTHEEVARSLEREFGLNRTQGVHAEREGEKPKDKRPTSKESQQEARTGWKKADAQAAISAAWAKCENGATFRQALEADGYRLAQGDKRDYVVVDPAGGPHSIRSGVRGLKVADIRERFADLSATTLPTVAEAKQAAIEAYPAFCEARMAAKAKPVERPATVSFRPTVPQPGRYDILRSPTPSRPEVTNGIATTSGSASTRADPANMGAAPG